MAGKLSTGGCTEHAMEIGNNNFCHSMKYVISVFSLSMAVSFREPL